MAENRPTRASALWSSRRHSSSLEQTVRTNLEAYVRITLDTALSNLVVTEQDEILTTLKGELIRYE